MNSRLIRFLIVGAIALASSSSIFALEQGKALVLQEMTWTDVSDYVKNCDMVIIPIGSTEQHGPQLPLGSDFFEALEMSKLISAQTGVIVAPVLQVGYSKYHSGFPGTLSIKPETMEKVVFEAVEMLMKYGFRRFIFFNYHGGNRIVQDKLVHRINHTTEAIAVAVGVGSPFLKMEESEFFDWHAGLNETSIMLYLMPDLVRMERAEKPRISFSPQMAELWTLGQKHPELMTVWKSLLGVPEETGKGGSSRELSSNGIWSFSDPRKATSENGKESVQKIVEKAVNFINVWKTVKSGQKRN